MSEVVHGQNLMPKFEELLTKHFRIPDKRFGILGAALSTFPEKLLNHIDYAGTSAVFISNLYYVLKDGDYDEPGISVHSVLVKYLYPDFEKQSSGDACQAIRRFQTDSLCRFIYRLDKDRELAPAMELTLVNHLRNILREMGFAEARLEKIKKLADIPTDVWQRSSKNSSPVIIALSKIFQELSSSKTAKKYAQEIKEWMTNAHRHLFNEELPESIYSTPDARNHTRSIYRMLIEIGPDNISSHGTHETRYTFRIWTWTAESGAQQTMSIDYDLDVKAIKDVIIAEIKNRFETPPYPIGIDFFIPRWLLHIDFDQWSFSLPPLFDGNKEISKKLGKICQIHIRPLERIKYDRVKPFSANWEDRWKQIKLHQPSVDSLFWLQRVHEDVNVLDESLNNCQPVGVVANRNIDEITEKGSIWMNHYGRVLRAGIPVFIWSRCPSLFDKPDTFKEIVESIFSKADPIEKIPERIQDLRKRATDSIPHQIGDHLSIMWDDPNRIIPEEEYNPHQH